jgi:hypothetical protein
MSLHNTLPLHYKVLLSNLYYFPIVTEDDAEIEINFRGGSFNGDRS